jgi:ParB family chromosome partitioning protein
MADDKKNIPEAAPPAEAPAPAVGNAVVPEQPAPEPALTNAETVMLEHEGQAALFEMGEAVPNPPTRLPTPRWRSLPLPKYPKPKRNRISRSLPARTILPRHIPQGGEFCRRP